MSGRPSRMPMSGVAAQNMPGGTRWYSILGPFPASYVLARVGFMIGANEGVLHRFAAVITLSTAGDGESFRRGSPLFGPSAFDVEGVPAIGWQGMAGSNTVMLWFPAWRSMSSGPWYVVGGIRSGSTLSARAVFACECLHGEALDGGVRSGADIGLSS